MRIKSITNSVFYSALLTLLTLVPYQLPAMAVPGQGTLYGIQPGEGSSLITIDTATGEGTVIGLTGVGALPSLAIGNGVFYAGGGGGLPVLYSLNPATGIAAVIGDTGLGLAAVGGMDFGPDGLLYASVNLAADGGSGSDHLAIIDPLTGIATVVGPFGSCMGVSIPSNAMGTCSLDGMEAIAFDAQGNLYGSLRQSDFSSGTPGLYLIDPDTGTAAFLTAITHINTGIPVPRGGVVSLQFACDGTLYGGTARQGEFADGFLVTINPATGNFAFVGNGTASENASLAALAFDLPCAGSVTRSVPSLSELGLLVLAAVMGLAGLIILRRRTALY